MSDKVLVLDIDGVVVHPHDGIFWNTQLTQDMGVCVDHLQKHYFGKYWSDVIIGKEDLKQTLKEYFKNHNFSYDVDKFIAYWFSKDANVDANLLNFIDAERNNFSKICLATNQEKYRAEYLWQEMGLSKHFDEFFYSGDLGCSKPEEDFYQLVTNNLEVQPEDIYFWDDSHKNVDGASKFGWNSFFFENMNLINSFTNK
jgi:putative hydrolase of the HAD superfamily